MTRIIAIAQHKGGTGKTTTVFQTGHGLANEGKKVLLVDADPQANLTTSLDIKDRSSIPTRNMYHYLTLKNLNPVPLEVNENLFVLPSHIDLIGGEIEMSIFPGREMILTRILKRLLEIEAYDYILIDCPPNLGVLTLNGMLASDEVFMAVQAEAYCMDGMSNLFAIMDRMRYTTGSTVEVTGMLITRVKRINLHKLIIKAVRERFGNLVFDLVIRENTQIGECVIHKKSIFEYAPTSNGAKDFRAFTNFILSKN